MTAEDLKIHQSTFDTPIKTTFRGVDVWEMPPNGQGITALLALNILEGFDFKGTNSILFALVLCTMWLADLAHCEVADTCEYR